MACFTSSAAGNELLSPPESGTTTGARLPGDDEAEDEELPPLASGIPVARMFGVVVAARPGGRYWD
jgi:hypothetical protein